MQNTSLYLRIRKIILQYSLILLSTILLVEVTLRIYNYFSPLFIFYTDSYNRYRGKPFSKDYDFKLNSMGFKDVEPRKKTADTYRILGIGDSFTYGVVPYKNNYLTVLEEKLKKHSKGIEIINMGIPDIGPIDYHSIFVREGLALKPDMIIVSFFTGNDLGSSRRDMLSYSYAGTLLYYIYTTILNYEGRIIHSNAKYCDDCPTFSPKSYLRIERNRSDMYTSSHKKTTRRWVTNSMVHLKRIKQVCDKHNIKLLVAIIPDEIQINDDLKHALINKYYPDVANDEWNETLPNSILAKQLKNAGISYLDLYHSFKSRSGDVNLYKPRDTHWNIAGNKLAAESLYDFIVKQKTIEPAL